MLGSCVYHKYTDKILEETIKAKKVLIYQASKKQVLFQLRW